ncbi:MAG: hypothetical protein J0L92_18180 [Deltaproteobacteria bacterium]|nr:hypothetical protein [Deltaproteobacteria bacterium]
MTRLLRSMQARALILVACASAVSVAIGCEGTGGGEDAGASARDAARSSDAPASDTRADAFSSEDAASADPDAAVPAGIAITAPLAGADVSESVLVRASAPTGTASVGFFVEDESTPRCTDDAAPFRCLVHLDPAGPAGPVRFTARATVSGTPSEASVTAMRRLRTLDGCTDALGGCVARWVTEGSAAGFAGITYENRDGTHARYDTSGMPGITDLTNDEGNFTWGTAGPSMDRSTIVIANVSKAYTSISASLVRYDVAWGRQYTSRYETQFLADKLFFYPEHVDCGVEDFYSFQTAAVFTSQGSSGSELDEVGKHLYALASMSSAVRTRLHDAGVLMDVLTMIHRRTRVASDAAYLTGIAHPTAFGNYDNDRAMALLAHALTEADLPPVARITTTDDTSPVQIADGPTLRARGFVTGGADEYALTADATTSRDLNARPLTYHWRVLRGDPSYVTIVPMNDEESVVRITFRRHPTAMYEGDGGAASTRITRTSNLLSIGLFVHNGVDFSAPVFVTSYSLDAQRGASGENNLD